MFVTRTAWLDWYVDGAESAVLVDGNVVVLSLLATTLVEAIGATGRSLVDLTDTLVAEFGVPMQGAAVTVTRAALVDLIGAGVLAVAPGA